MKTTVIASAIATLALGVSCFAGTLPVADNSKAMPESKPTLSETAKLKEKKAPGVARHAKANEKKSEEKAKQ